MDVQAWGAPRGAFSDSSCSGVVFIMSFATNSVVFAGITQSCGGVFRSLAFLFDEICLTWCIGMRQHAKWWVLYRTYR